MPHICHISHRGTLGLQGTGTPLIGINFEEAHGSRVEMIGRHLDLRRVDLTRSSSSYISAATSSHNTPTRGAVTFQPQEIQSIYFMHRLRMFLSSRITQQADFIHTHLYFIQLPAATTQYNIYRRFFLAAVGQIDTYFYSVFI